MRAGDLSLGRTGVALKDTYMMRVPWGMRVEAGGRRWMVNGTADLCIASPEDVIKNFLPEEDLLAVEPGERIRDYFISGGKEHGVMPCVRDKICGVLRPLIVQYVSGRAPSAAGLEECLNGGEAVGQLSAALKGFKLDGAPHILKVGTLERVPDAG